LALAVVPAFAPEEINRLWGLVDAALPSLSTLRGGPPAVTGLEDLGVPPADLSAFLTRVQGVLQRHETTAAFLVHASAGQVELRPFLDPADPADAARLWAIAEDVYALALELGGTISARHGTGLARTPWVAKQYPQLTPVFRELKTIFDPRPLFNPGDVVGPDPSRPAWPLRSQVASPVLSAELKVLSEDDSALSTQHSALYNATVTVLTSVYSSSAYSPSSRPMPDCL
jgi:FAD/FMN-containing dehydrogenase